MTDHPTGTAAWLEGLLRDRLGPGSALGAITFEGRIVHVDGARVPLGGGAVIELAHVALELGAGLPLGGLPLSARLVALRAEIHASGRVFPISFASGDAVEASWAHGTLRLGAPPGHVASHPAGHPIPSGPAGLELTLTARAGELVLAGARSHLELRGTADDSSFRDARLTGHVALADVIDLVPGGADPRVEAVVDLDLAAVGSLASGLRGRLSASEVRVARAGGATVLLTDVSAVIDLDRRRLCYQDLRGVAGGARFGGWGRVPVAPPEGEATAVPLVALRIERAGAALLAAIAGIAGLRRSRAIPPDFELTGELMVSADRAVSGSFALETPRSALLFHLVLGAGRELLGSTLRGRFAAADAITAGLFPGAARGDVSAPKPPVCSQPADVFALDARLSGTLARPGVTGRLSAAEVSLEVASTMVVCHDVSVLLDVDPDRLAWQRLAGTIYGGHVSSSGRLSWRAGALDATLVWNGVRVEELPGRSAGEGALAKVLRGGTSGELRFERVGAVALAARGRVTISDPVYLGLRHVAPVLLRYGLPPISPCGTRPVTAAVRLERGELTVESLSAAVSGIDVDGGLRFAPGGSLTGRLRVHLLEGYLERSPLLAIPAAFAGRVVIPVYLGGSASAPEVRTDAVEILDDLFHGSRAREALKGALDALSSAVRASRKRR